MGQLVCLFSPNSFPIPGWSELSQISIQGLIFQVWKSDPTNGFHVRDMTMKGRSDCPLSFWFILLFSTFNSRQSCKAPPRWTPKGTTQAFRYSIALITPFCVMRWNGRRDSPPFREWKDRNMRLSGRNGRNCEEVPSHEPWFIHPAVFEFGLFWRHRLSWIYPFRNFGEAGPWSSRKAPDDGEPSAPYCFWIFSDGIT